MSAATPIETASAPSASALATSAPERIPPETTSWMRRCIPSSWSASTARRTAGSVGIPTCSMKTSCVAAVPPCMPSRTMTSAPGLDRERDVEVGARRSDLDEDRLLPVGDLAQLLDLDLEVVGPGPVGVTARAALVDARRQVAHLRDAVGDLLAEQDPAAAGLGALADHDLDRVGAAQVVGVHPVARRQQLVDERLGRRALLGRHAAVAGRRRGAHRARAATQRLLGRRRQRAEAHAGDRDRDVELERALGVARAEHDVRVAALAIALERIARHARPEQQEVVEVGEAALGAEAADVVDALARGALDLGDDLAAEERRLAQGHLRSLPAWSTLKL